MQAAAGKRRRLFPSPVDFSSNGILASLSRADQQSMTEYLEPRVLRFRQRVEPAGRKIRNIYFIEAGMASVIAVAGGADRRQTEVGIIGCEGVTGIAALLGADRTPHETLMQIAGKGYCITAERMRALMNQSKSLSHAIYRYAHAFSIQSSQTLLANTRGTVEERLARWLLMSQDRLKQAEIRLTHEFLALMLGVRRPGVTIALHRLEDLGFVASTRGSTTVLNRDGLRKYAKGFYGVPEAEYERLFGKT
jgi:CRP-like cAMP-binding protein